VKTILKAVAALLILAPLGARSASVVSIPCDDFMPPADPTWAGKTCVTDVLGLQVDGHTFNVTFRDVYHAGQTDVSFGVEVARARAQELTDAIAGVSDLMFLPRNYQPVPLAKLLYGPCYDLAGVGGSCSYFEIPTMRHDPWYFLDECFPGGWCVDGGWWINGNAHTTVAIFTPVSEPGGGSVSLADLTLKSSEVAGCKGVTGWVTLSAPAPVGGTIVTISDTLASAKTPATVKIREGATSNYFTISTTPVAANQDGMVTASLESKSSDQPLTVRPMGLTSMTLTPTNVVGSNGVTGKATLECNAGPGPITVDLASNNAGVAYPVAASIVVPQGVKTANFDVTTNAVHARSYATISGKANGITKSKKLTVNVAASVSPTRLGFGNVAVGTTSSPLGATLTNRGAVPFSVTGISLTGTGASWFAQTNNCPANLAAGASCTINVTFTPRAAANKSAKLTIATSATSTPLSVSLTGTGT